jgi:hypothetical protein
MSFLNFPIGINATYDYVELDDTSELPTSCTDISYTFDQIHSSPTQPNIGDSSILLWENTSYHQPLTQPITLTNTIRDTDTQRMYDVAIRTIRHRYSRRFRDTTDDAIIRSAWNLHWFRILNEIRRIEYCLQGTLITDSSNAPLLRRMNVLTAQRDQRVLDQSMWANYIKHLDEHYCDEEPELPLLMCMFNRNSKVLVMRVTLKIPLAKR